MWTKMRSSLAGGPQKLGLRSTWTYWSVSYLTNVNGPLPTVGFWKNGCCSSWLGSTAPRMCSGQDLEAEEADAGNEASVRRVEVEAEGGVVDDDQARRRVDLAVAEVLVAGDDRGWSRRRGGAGVHGRLEGELDVLGGQRRAVAPLHAFAQVEGDRLAVGAGLPAFAPGAAGGSSRRRRSAACPGTGTRSAGR